MTQYQLTLDSEAVQRLFTGDGQLGRLVEAVLNQVVNAQVAEQLQVAPYEPTNAASSGRATAMATSRANSPRGSARSPCWFRRYGMGSSRPRCSRATSAANRRWS